MVKKCEIYIDPRADVSILDEATVVEHSGEFKTPNVGFGVFAYDADNNIVAISGRTLKVINLSESNGNKLYFQAWVSGYQNDGFSHNEAVKSALDFAEKDKRSN